MNTPAQWLVIAGIVVADAVGLPLAGLRLGASGVAMLAAMVAALLGLALVYRRLSIGLSITTAARAASESPAFFSR